MKISQRTGEIIIVAIIILLNLWLLGSGAYGGRSTDYQESSYSGE
jgi:hypothetical protein